MTPKWFVVDAHNHLIPEKAAKLAGTADGFDFKAVQKKRAHGLKKTQDVEQRLRLMDEAGVDMAMINTASWSPQGIEMCRAINDGYAEIMAWYPQRFLACVHVPLAADSEVLDELRRAVEELGFKGVSLVSSTQACTIDDEKLFPLYEAISQLDIPVIIHPTLRDGLWGGDRYEMAAHVSREYDIAKATVEVMYGVLPRFPDLKFVIPHHGGGIPSLKGRIMAWFQPEGWEVPDHLRNMAKTPRELESLGLDKAFADIFDKLYFDTAGFGGWMPITEGAVKTIRTDRICFGTDYPFEIHDTEDVKGFIDDIKRLVLPESEKRNILGENIRRLFDLPLVL
jgi:predicted TIM-barrel fold metal-dependent hydrolase